MQLSQHPPRAWQEAGTTSQTASDMRDHPLHCQGSKSSNFTSRMAPSASQHGGSNPLELLCTITRAQCFLGLSRAFWRFTPPSGLLLQRKFSESLLTSGKGPACSHGSELPSRLPRRAGAAPCSRSGSGVGAGCSCPITARFPHASAPELVNMP